MPFFSVVVPAFNASEKIKLGLNSLLGQTYKDFEVVIVDDCSDDFDVLSENISYYIDSGVDIRLYQLEKHINGAGARNKAIKMAKGEYIAFLDSDDEWVPEKLQCCYDFIQSCYEENYILYNKVEIINSDSKMSKIMPTREIRSCESVGEYLFGYSEIIQTSGIVLRRHDAVKIMFNENYTRHQDYDFCIRAYHAGYKFVLIDAPLSIYHVDKNTVKKESSAYSKFWVEDMKQFFDIEGYHCFKAYVLSYKYFKDGFLFKAVIVFIMNVIGAGKNAFIFNVKRILRKIFFH